MGARQLRDQLNLQGLQIGLKRVKTLMKAVVIEAVYCKPNTSKKTPGHEIFPWLLRGITIHRTNQVWALHTTYIPLAEGFAYFTAVVDWATRKVLAAKVAVTPEACLWWTCWNRLLSTTAQAGHRQHRPRQPVHR